MKQLESTVFYAIVLSFFIVLVSLGPSFTGLVVGGENSEAIEVNQLISNSTTLQYELRGNLSSLRISGDIIGNGTVLVFVNGRIVADSSKIDGQKENLITGFAISGVNTTVELPGTENLTTEAEEDTSSETEENITGLLQAEEIPVDQDNSGPNISVDNKENITSENSSHSPADINLSGNVSANISSSSSKNMTKNITQSSPPQNISSNISLNMTGNLTANISINLTNASEEIENISVDNITVENISVENKSIQNLRDENFTVNITPENISAENLSAENITLNITEGNASTVNLSENMTLQNITANITADNLTTSFVTVKHLEDYCLESCDLNLGNNISIMILLEDAYLNLSTITYTYIEPVQAENIILAAAEDNYTSVEINKPVKWTRKINTSLSNITRLDSAVFNVSINNRHVLKINDNEYSIAQYNDAKQREKLEKRLEQLEGRTREGDVKNVVLEISSLSREISELEQIELEEEVVLELEPDEIVEIEYYTDGPEVNEIRLSSRRKIVEISSEFSYENVLTYTDIFESKKENIEVYWIEQDRQLFSNITYVDTNDNGLVDRLVWYTPHLSDQSFEIVLSELESEIEQPELRTITSKTNQIFNEGRPTGRFITTAGMAPVHYMNSSGELRRINISFRPVNNSRLDGWVVDSNGWHFAMGQPADKTTDGWIGYGGNQGEHWLQFRLSRVGYLHWPTRNWDDLGGDADYSRENLELTTNSTEFARQLLPISGKIRWDSLWQTPAGDVYSEWVVNGAKLKEEVVIEDEVREWIAQNRAPSTPLGETYFGFVFEIDASDIPRVYRRELLMDMNNDFSDDNETIELRDELDELIGFMPISDLIVKDSEGNEIERVEMRKRFYRVNGRNYLVVGLRTDVLADLPEGDLVFDPSVNYQISASADDQYQSHNGLMANRAGTTLRMSANTVDNSREHGGMRWQVYIDQGATIDSANVSLYTTSGDDPLLDIFAEDSDSASVFPNFGEDNYNITDRPRTSNISWTENNVGENTWVDTPDLKDIIQEVIDRPGWSSGNYLAVLTFGYGNETSDFDARTYDFSDNTYGPKITIAYDGALANTPPSATLNYPETNATVDYSDPILLNITPLDVENATLNVSFFNASNNLELCGNISVANNSLVYCGVSLELGDELKWYVNVTDEGDTAQSDTWNFTINDDVVPSINSVSISPGTAYTNNNLSCIVNIGDTDNATIDVEYWWYNSSDLLFSGNATGVSRNADTSISVLGSGNTSHFESWNCTVRANDGTYFSGYSSSVINITNIVPTHNNPTITPDIVLNTTDLTCNWNSVDDGDMDSVQNITNWYRNGESLTILHMPFEGGSNSTYAKDYSGRGINGEVSGAAWNRTGGKVGGAYEFNGDGDYVQLSSFTHLDNATDFTFMAWIKPGFDQTETTPREILAEGNDIRLFYMATANDFRFNVDTGTINYVETDDISWANNTWHHIAATYNGTALSIYWDGELNNTAAGAGEVDPSADDGFIGRPTVTSNYFHGMIDEVKIFNRSLSAAQIYKEYVAGESGTSSQVMVSEETSLDEEWICSVTPDDGYGDGTTKNSSTAFIRRELEISACAELSQNNTIYKLTADIPNSGETVCMNITGFNNVLDCQANMIEGQGSVGPDAVLIDHSNTWTETNHIIKNCTFKDWGYGVRVAYAQNNLVTHINATNNHIGIFEYQGQYNTFRNIIAENGTWGMYRNHGLGNFWENITATENSNSDFEYVGLCRDKIANITGSRGLPILYHNNSESMRDLELAGLIICNADYANFTNITITGSDSLNNNYLKVLYTEHAAFSKITSIDNLYGMLLGFSSNITVNDSVFVNNGIFVDASATNLTMTNSIIEKEVDAIEYSSSSQFGKSRFYNNIINATYLDISGTFYEQYWNTTNFTGIRIKAHGFTLGGNYWTNSSGTGYSDVCTDADRDGFCDTPFNVTTMTECTAGVSCGINTDYLPLSDEAPNPAPTMSTPTITPAYPNTTSTLVCNWNDVSDFNGDPVVNITNWYKDNVSTTLLYLPFEGGSNSTYTKDYSGHNSTIVVEGPNWTQSIGKIGGGYLFNGSSGFLNISSSSIDNLSIRTIDVWIYPVGWGEGEYGRVMHKSSPDANSKFWGIYLRGPTRPYTQNSISYAHGWTASGGGFAQWTAPSDSITLNEWNHIVIYYNRTSESNKPAIYINGINQTVTTLNASEGVPGDDTGKPLLIGNREIGDRTFDGKIDEIKIYNYELSSTQIYQEYTAGINNKSFNTLSFNDTTAGEEWLCSVTVNDGFSDGDNENSSIVTIADAAPVFVGEATDASSSDNPTNEGSNVTFTANATEDDGDTWQLHVCSPLGFESGACADTTYCTSGFVASGTETSCEFNTTGTTAEVVNWYAYAYDGTSVSSVSYTNSPFNVNHRPYVYDVALNDTSPGTNATLSCNSEFADSDAGDVEGSSVYIWYEQNQGAGAFSEIAGETSVTLDLNSAGLDINDVLRCGINPVDSHGLANGTFVNSSNTATIENIPPEITGMNLYPADGNVSSSLECNVTVIDLDNSTTIIEYWWYNSSEFVLGGNTSIGTGSEKTASVLGAGNTSRMEMWNCTVRANDGMNYSGFDSRTINISNVPPELVTNIENRNFVNDSSYYFNISPYFNSSAPLTYGATPANDFTINFNQSTGIVNITPINGFTGRNTVYFNASDGMNVTTSNLVIIESHHDLTISSNYQMNATDFLDGVFYYRNIELEEGATLTMAGTYTTDSDGYGVTLNATGNLSIRGTVNADGRGYDGGTTNDVDGDGPGAGTAGGMGQDGGGGAYGGDGGDGDQAGGDYYGSRISPADLGSGGGGAYNNGVGGDGGGSIRLIVGEVANISGALTADGGSGTSNGWHAGGGAGGTIYLSTSSFTGSGSLTATGGSAGGANGGAGAGGRIAVYYSEANSFTGSYDTTPGTTGKSAQDGTSMVVDTANMDLTIPTDNGPWKPGHDNSTYRNILIQGDVIIDGTYTTDSDGVGVVINATSNFSLEPGNIISGTANGYDGGVSTNSDGDGPGGGTGGGGGQDGGGGGYGGDGGNGDQAGGSSYGSLTRPLDLGSGGGGAYNGARGGDGGSAISIVAGDSINISGNITMGGGSGTDTSWHGGGGSGGSIYLLSDSIFNIGYLYAKGGNAGGANGGAGAGGRISVIYRESIEWDYTKNITTAGTTGGNAEDGSSYFLNYNLSLPYTFSSTPVLSNQNFSITGQAYLSDGTNVSSKPVTVNINGTQYYYNTSIGKLVNYNTGALPQTNATGHFNYTFLSLPQGVYWLYINSTETGEHGTIEGSSNISFTVAPASAPQVISNVTIPLSMYYDSNAGATSAYISAEATDIDEAVVSVNFTVIAPDSSISVNNVGAAESSGDIWNSTIFTVDQYGVWSFNVTAIDSQDLTYTSNGTINFLQITSGLSTSDVPAGNPVTVSGHINDSSWSDLVNNTIEIRINNTRYFYNETLDIIVNYSTGNDTQTNSTGHYSYSFNAPSGSGDYIVKVNSTYGTEYGEQTINLTVDGAPTVSSVTLAPIVANVTDDLICNATIIDENSTLTVEYWWYNSSDFILGGNATTIATGSSQTISTLGTGNTSLWELWNCTVRAYDGDLYSGFDSDSINISNSVPVALTIENRNMLNDSTIYINLSEYMIDSDSDTLTFGATAMSDFTLELNENTGMVNITPVGGFTGRETVVFNVTDGINTTESNSVIIESHFDLTISSNYQMNATDFLNGVFYYRNVIVESGNTLTIIGNYTNNSNGYGVTLSIINFTLSESSTIDMQGTGYSGGDYEQQGFGPGGGGLSSWVYHAGGAGYGGDGGDGSVDPGGNAYGSLTHPLDLGSGGGGSDYGLGLPGGNGGGAIFLNATGTINISGNIDADGNAGGDALADSGGGSGGSIYVIANYLVGDGYLYARGGTGNDGGGGGGGRISIIFRNPTSWNYSNNITTGAAANGQGGTSYSLRYYINTNVELSDYEASTQGEIIINGSTNITDASTLSNAPITILFNDTKYYYNSTENRLVDYDTGTLPQTDSEGIYNYSLLLPNSEGTYIVYVNTSGSGTHGWVFGNTSTQINISSDLPPSIISINNEPSNMYYDSNIGATSTYLSVETTDENNDIATVNFTITAPDSTIIINNVNASKRNGNIWNSSSFYVDQYGQWNYSVTVMDSYGNSDNENSSITFLQITESLSESITNTGAYVTVSGHINDSTWTPVSNRIGIYINDTPLSELFGWWNLSWNKRVNISVESLVASDLNDSIIAINFSTLGFISDNEMESDCSDIRFLDQDNQLPYIIEQCNSSDSIFLVWRNWSGTQNNTIYAYFDNDAADFLGMPENPDKSLVAYYPLGNLSSYGESESLAADFSGQENNLTISEAYPAPGRIGGGYEFDGSNDYLEDTSADLGMSEDHAFTILLWLYSNATRHDGSFVSYGGPSNGNVISIVQHSSGSFYSVHYGNDHAFTTRVADEVWQHVALTYDPDTSTEILYVNGSYKEDWSPNNLNLDPTDRLRIGRSTWNGVYMNTGRLDDVRIYNRTLSADEITAIYNSTSTSVRGNESQLMTNSTGHYSITFNAPGSEGEYIVKVNSTYNGEYGEQTQGLTVLADIAPTVSLNIPFDQDHSVNLQSNITFNCSVYDTGELDNLTLYSNINGSWDIIDSVEISGSSNSTLFRVDASLMDGSNAIKDSQYIWNCIAFDEDSQHDWGDSNFTFSGWDLGSYNKSERNTNNISLTSNDTKQELPDSGINDGWINMSGNVLLLHFNNDSYYGESSLQEGNIFDFSGNENNGTLGNSTGGNAPSHVDYGILNSAFEFDGVNDFIVVQDHDTLDGMSELTVSIWVNPTEWGNNEVIIRKGKDEYNYQLANPSTNKVRFRVDTTTTTTLDTLSSLPLDAWTFITATYNGTDMKIYINGVEDASTAHGSGGNVESGSKDLDIGMTVDGSPFNGTIDEVAIWNRSLSSEEINNIYKRQKGEYIDRAAYESKIFDAGIQKQWRNISIDLEMPYIGLELPSNGEVENLAGGVNMSGNVLLLHMNEDTGTISDYSGQDNDGTESGGVLYSQPGKFNTGIGFEGNNEYIDVGTMGTFGSSIGSSTVSVWVKTEDKTAAGEAIMKIIDASGETVDVVYGIEPNRYLTSGCSLGYTSSGYTLFYIRDNAGNVYAKHMTTSIMDGEWHHLVWRVIDASSNQMEVYLDGESVSLTGSCSQSPSSFNDWTDSFVVGADNNRGTLQGYFNGTLDEIAIWDRTLSQTEIQNLYERGLMRVNITARACDDSQCSGEQFTYLGNNASFTDLGSLQQEQYFQYRLDYETYDHNYTPELDLDSAVIKYQEGVFTPVINSNETVPSSVFYDSNTAGTSVYLTVEATDPDDNIISVNFTVIAPDSTIVLNNIDASESAGNIYNSTSFTVDQYGQWNYSVTATDADSGTYTSNGTINFLEISLDMSSSAINQDETFTLSGHINDSLWNDAAGTVLGIYLNDTPAEIDGWWNVSWLYRRPINITENNGTSLTDYEVNLTINTSGLINEGKLNSSCKDLRFTDDDQNELFYWLESGCDSTSTKVWVRMNLSANNNETIFMYYGNNDAINVSSQSNTFTIYDDFEDGSIDSMWTQHAGYGSISETSGVMRLSCPAYTVCQDRTSYITIYTPRPSAVNYIFETDVVANNYPNTFHVGLSEFSTTDDFSKWGPRYSISEDEINLRGSDGGGWVVPGTTIANTADTGKLRIEVTRDSESQYFFHTTLGGTQEYWSDETNVGIFYSANNQNDATAATADFEWFRLRKLTNPIPTLEAVGAEETGVKTNSTGHYSVVVSAPSPGVYTLTVNSTYNGEYGEQTDSLTVLQNQPPPKVTLLSPTDENSTLYQNPPDFMWEAAVDPNGDSVNYTINITSDVCPDYGLAEKIVDTNYTPTSELVLDCTYNWSVRAYDGQSYGEWSDRWSFTLQPTVIITLVNDTVDFGELDPGESADTDTRGGPFVVRNDGNVFANITYVSINESIFTTVSDNTEYFMFKVDNSTAEPGSFNYTGSTTAWTNLTLISNNNQTAIAKLNYSDASDEAEIDINVTVPLSEPGGVTRTVTLYVIGEES